MKILRISFYFLFVSLLNADVFCSTALSSESYGDIAETAEVQVEAGEVNPIEPVEGEQKAESVIRYNTQEVVAFSKGCTEIACDSLNPCCNTCEFGGWHLQYFSLKAVSDAGRLPYCQLDGCGQCPYNLEADGFIDTAKDPGIFRVTRWRVVQKFESDPTTNPATAATSGSAFNSELERKQQEQGEGNDWMERYKQQNKEHMEELKKTNPDQFQQVQQLMESLQVAPEVPKQLQQQQE